MKLIAFILIGSVFYGILAHPQEARDLMITIGYSVENFYHYLMTPGGKIG